MKYQIIADEQVDEVLQMTDAITRIESALNEHAEGTLAAPARFVLDSGEGNLVFTAGASTGQEASTGFRVYETFPKKSPGNTQLVVVFDGKSGVLKGIVTGFRIGVIRTGAIGGIALKYLAKSDAKTLGLIGSGTQARSQLEAASVVRKLKTIKVYSPTREHRESFASEMSEKLNLEIDAVSSSDEAIGGSEIVICATRSKKPVFNAELLERGMHVTTLGPNLEGTNEIEMKVAERSHVIVTDSFAQLDSYEKYTNPYFLAKTIHRERMRELGKIASGEVVGRTSDDEITLFCSVGLAGTEVYIANEVFKRLTK